MRIMILANKGSNHAKKCAEGMQVLGHEVFFVSPNDSVDDSVVLNPGIRLITLKYGGKKGYISNAFELRKVFREIKPDVVNVHYASGCGFLSFLAGLHPVVLNCYGSDIFEFPHLNRFNYFLLRRVLNSADALASTSHAMAAEIRSILKNAQKPIAITPFGVDVNLFSANKNRVNNERPVVAIVKSLLPVYDIPLLINAFKIVKGRKTAQDPVLKIYGNGPLRKELEELVNDSGLAESVSFMGAIPNSQVPEVLNSIDVLVNCSRQESFGVSILEAMACELPVIVTDCVGPRELTNDGECGIILRESTPECLAGAIITLLENPGLRKDLGQKGRIRVLESYDWNNNMRVLEKVLIDNKRS